MDFLPEGLRPLAALLPFVLAMMVLTLVLRFARNGAPNRLAEVYHAVEPVQGTRLRLERAVFGRWYFSMAWVKIGADRERLHVRVMTSHQGAGSFSVPLDQVTATPDRYGWMILAPDTVRLCFLRAPEALMRVFPGDFLKLAEASGGRLRLEPAHAAAARAPAPAGGRS
jgi:hypothetical protein